MYKGLLVDELSCDFRNTIIFVPKPTIRSIQKIDAKVIERGIILATARAYYNYEWIIPNCVS
jgi:hypothetical protein